MTLSLPVAVESSATAVSSKAVTTELALPRPRPSFHWALAALACLLAAAAGVSLYFARHPKREVPKPTEAEVSATPGLPEVRSPDKLVATRERELLDILASRQTRPEKVVNASIELGLLYLHGGRLDEASDRFAQLENEKFGLAISSKKVDPDFFSARYGSAAGRLGRAVVLAHRDTPEGARQSNDLILNVVSDPFPRLSKFDKRERGVGPVSDFLLRHPDLGEAVADAINRNSATLGRTPPLTPAALEQLRVPPRYGKKE